MVDQLAAAARAQAQAQARRNCVMVVVTDPTQACFHVYNLDLTDLFSPRRRPQSHGDKLLTFADPLAILRYADIGVDMEVAASASGHVIAAAATSGQTFIVDAAATRSLSPVPGTRHVKRNFFHVPVGDKAFFLMRKFFLRGAPQGRTCELLFSPPNSSSWGCCALPDPPGLHPRWEVDAYFVAGAHVWVSLCSQGTFSFDTVSRRWHTQGTWELPFNGAAVFVPDFRGSGRNLLFGFVGTVLRLSACDMDAMPPAIIASWPETCPSRARYAFSAQTVELTYFGDGRFCIALNAAIQTEEEEEDRPTPRRSIVSLMAVEITRDMKLIKRHFRRYALPPSSHTTHLLLLLLLSSLETDCNLPLNNQRNHLLCHPSGIEAKDSCVTGRVCPQLVKLLMHASANILLPVITSLARISAGDDTQVQVIIEKCILPCLAQLLARNYPKLIKNQACLIVSNIAVGSKDQIQDSVIDADVMNHVVVLLKSSDIHKEAAWAISNAASGGSSDQIQYLVSRGCLEPLCNVLKYQDVDLVYTCLEGLQNILEEGEIGKQGKESATNPYAQFILENGGLDSLEDLQDFDNAAVYRLVMKLLKSY